MTDLSKNQLNTILSAIEGERRNHSSKDAALNAIARHADRLGLATDDIIAAASGLLDGRMGAEAFRDELTAESAIVAEGRQDDAAVETPADDAPPAQTSAPDVEPTATGELPAQQVIQKNPPRQRDNSKQARVIEMLRRPEGATIHEIMEETRWASHTVRGFFAGALKKKLGLTVTSEKGPGEERVYRIA